MHFLSNAIACSAATVEVFLHGTQTLILLRVPASFHYRKCHLLRCCIYTRFLCGTFTRLCDDAVHIIGIKRIIPSFILLIFTTVSRISTSSPGMVGFKLIMTVSFIQKAAFIHEAAGRMKQHQNEWLNSNRNNNNNIHKTTEKWGCEKQKTCSQQTHAETMKSHAGFQRGERCRSYPRGEVLGQ